MAKDITNNIRSLDSYQILHLFEFDIYNLDGTFDETLYFVDHDIFVELNAIEYTPLAITFDILNEDSSLNSDDITVTIDNISGALTEVAISKEWRNNPCRIKRVLFLHDQEVYEKELYEFGIGNNLDEYPKLTLDNLNKDIYTLYEGIIDSFTASEKTLMGKLSSLFINWQKPDPIRTYNQNEFTTIIDTVSDTVYWGREKDV